MMEQPTVHEEGIMAGTICPDAKAQWPSRVGKAAEFEFLLFPSGVALIRGSKWKVWRAADWEEPGEWKFLTSCCSPLVEQLCERLVRMEMQEPAPMNPSVPGAGLLMGQASAALSPSLLQ